MEEILISSQRIRSTQRAHGRARRLQDAGQRVAAKTRELGRLHTVEGEDGQAFAGSKVRIGENPVVDLGRPKAGPEGESRPRCGDCGCQKGRAKPTIDCDGMEHIEATGAPNRQKSGGLGVIKFVSGLAVSSGSLAVCFQVIAWVIRAETDAEMSVSWFNSYVGSAAFLFGLATVKAIFSPAKTH